MAKLESKEKAFYCSSCKEERTDPVTLSCYHSVCQQCFTRSETVHTDEHNFCPVCETNAQYSDSVDSLRSQLGTFIDSTSHTLEDLLVKFGMTYCSVCCLHNQRKEATNQCLDCADVLCDDCHTGHQSSSATYSHRVVAIQDVITGKYVVDAKKKFPCGETNHRGRSYAYFCQSCVIPICELCFLFQHKGHEVLTLDDAVQNRTRKLRDRSHQLSKSITESTSMLEKFRNLHRDISSVREATVKCIRDKAQIAVDLILEQEQAAVNKLSKACDRQFKLISTLDSDLEQISSLCPKLLSLTKLVSGQDMSVLVLHTDLEKCFHESKKLQDATDIFAAKLKTPVFMVRCDIPQSSVISFTHSFQDPFVASGDSKKGESIPSDKSASFVLSTNVVNAVKTDDCVTRKQAEGMNTSETVLSKANPHLSDSKSKCFREEIKSRIPFAVVAPRFKLESSITGYVVTDVLRSNENLVPEPSRVDGTSLGCMRDSSNSCRNGDSSWFKLTASLMIVAEPGKALLVRWDSSRYPFEGPDIAFTDMSPGHLESTKEETSGPSAIRQGVTSDTLMNEPMNSRSLKGNASDSLRPSGPIARDSSKSGSESSTIGASAQTFDVKKKTPDNVGSTDMIQAEPLNTDTPDMIQAEPLNTETSDMIQAELLNTDTPDMILAEPLNTDTPDMIQAEPLNTDTPDMILAEPLNTDTPDMIQAELLNTETSDMIQAELLNTDTPDMILAEPLNTDTPDMIQAEPLNTDTPDMILAELLNTETSDMIQAEPLNTDTPDMILAELLNTETSDMIQAEPLNTDIPDMILAEPLNTDTPDMIQAEPLNTETTEMILAEPLNTETPDMILAEPLNTDTPDMIQAEPMNTETSDMIQAEPLNTETSDMIQAEPLNTDTPDMIQAELLNTETSDMILAEPLNTDSPDMILAEPLNTETPDMILAEPLNTETSDMILAEPLNTEPPDVILAEPLNTDTTEVILSEPENTDTTEMILSEPQSTITADMILSESQNTETTEVILAELQHTGTPAEPLNTEPPDMTSTISSGALNWETTDMISTVSGTREASELIVARLNRKTSEIVPAGPQNRKTRELFPSRTQNQRTLELVPVSPQDRKTQEFLPAGPQDRYTHEFLPAGPENRKTHKFLPVGPQDRYTHEFLPDGPQDRKTQEFLPAGPQDRKTQEFLPAGPQDRKTHEFLPAGPENRKILELIKAGPQDRQNREPFPAGPENRKTQELVPAGPENPRTPAGPQDRRTRELVPAGPETRKTIEPIPAGSQNTRTPETTSKGNQRNCCIC